jgi:cytochrome c553
MAHKRIPYLLAVAALLAGCGDKASEQADAPQPEAAVEAAAPAAEMAAPADNVDTSVGDVDAATLYARSCASCHGATGEGVAGFPSLAALSRDLIQARLETYRAGETVGPKSAVMHPVAKGLSNEQIAALAAYLGS